MTLEELKQYLYGCTHCGTCKDVLNIFAPACPSGEKYQLESYFPSGKMLIARGIIDGDINLEDDDIRERIYACTGCLSCEQQCGVYHHQHIFETVQAMRTESVTQGALNPAYMVMIESLKKDDNVFGKPKLSFQIPDRHLERRRRCRTRRSRGVLIVSQRSGPELCVQISRFGR